MKLFIINKSIFDNAFPNSGNSIYKTSKQIHQEAYKVLQNSLYSENKIPKKIKIQYREDGFAILEFVRKIDSVYSYVFLELSY